MVQTRLVEAGWPSARYKGQAETTLPAAGFPRVYIFRPAFTPSGPRREPNLSYRI
jgi:hypothetical protein